MLSTVVLARMLTPDDFGIIGIVNIFIAFSQMMVDSEMGGALLRKKEVTRLDYSTLFYYNLLVSIGLYAILWFAAPLISKFYNRPPLEEIIRIISFTIIIHAFRVVQKIMIFRDLKFRIYAVINIVSGLCSLGVAIYLAHLGYGYWALVWQQIALALCNVLCMEIYNRFVPLLAFSKESFRYQFSFGISLLGSDGIKTIANNISTNIIAKISTLQFTGYYTQSSRISSFCQGTFGSLLDQCIFPMLSKIEDPLKLRYMFYKILRYMCLGMGLMTIGMIVFAPQIVDILLGKEWQNAAWMVRILTCTILPASIQVLCRNIIKVTGRTRIAFYLETVKSIILIGALFIGIMIGTTGVLWAIVVTQLIMSIVWLIVINKQLKIEIARRSDK